MIVAAMSAQDIVQIASVAGGLGSSLAITALMYYKQVRETKRLQDIEDMKAKLNQEVEDDRLRKELLKTRVTILENVLVDRDRQLVACKKVIDEKDIQIGQQNEMFNNYKTVIETELKNLRASSAKIGTQVKEVKKDVTEVKEIQDTMPTKVVDEIEHRQKENEP